MVAHICNPSYLRGRDKKIMVQDQPGKKFSKTISKTTWVWWCVCVIPATQEAEVGELRSEDSLGKSMRPYL
jgi:hypothetical protein